MAVPAVKTIISAKSKRIIIKGNSQNFLRIFKNCQSSLKKLIVYVLIWVFNIVGRIYMFAYYHY